MLETSMDACYLHLNREALRTLPRFDPEELLSSE